MKPSDVRWMRRALEAAEGGRGRVSPNPMVGAVLVRGGRLIAEGHHGRYGGAHAEVVALRRAGARARGATLYVSLEPCDHQGKTPPCADAIVRSGVRRVVAAIRDPHPLVNGRGFRHLRRAGVRVDTGVLAREARRLNEAYLCAVTRGRPLVTLKSGLSLDGRIATASGASRWITSPASRREAHRLRAEHDAVLVGIGTALADAPRLDARAGGAGVRQPARVVLDSGLKLDPHAPMVRARGGGEILVYALHGGDARARRLESAGVRIVEVHRGPGGVDLGDVLADLASRGIHSVLVEGGSRVAWSFLRAGLADRIVWYLAPRILGGERAVPVVGGPGVAVPEEAFGVRELAVRRLGPDVVVTGRLDTREKARGTGRSRRALPAGRGNLLRPPRR